MEESQVCPECNAVLPGDAPGGLCPRCLVGAVVDETQTVWDCEATDVVGDRDGVSGPAVPATDAIRSSASVSLDRFKRSILELGLIRESVFERRAAGAPGGVQGLAGALVRAGKLTAYQASALSQGKARGLVIGNYFILDKLGAGGMGVVFKARHRRLGRVVALKMLLPSLARNKDLLSRFRREVEVAARLSHPNIVSVLDADEDRGVQFMTMEYIQGNDLDRLVRDGGAMPIDLALECVIQSARGLEAAHAQGIVHRDIKPGNLMLDGSGVVRVLDLGLARLIEAVNPFGDASSGPLTRSGMYMGTVDFMAPEQGIDSRRVDHRADIYSLGCTLCFLLTGRAPFGGDNVLSRLVAHQDQLAPSLRARRTDVPRSIDAAYREMMSKKPADRPASMGEVIERLETCRSSAGEARSGLQSFATTALVKRASSKTTVPDPALFSRERAEGLQVGLDPRFETPAFDDRDEGRPARSTVAPPAIEEPAPTAKATQIARPLRAGRRKLTALAIGSLALLAAVGLACFLISRPSSSPSAADLSIPPESKIRPGQESVSAGSSTVPRSFTTFGVTTLYTTYGDNREVGSVEALSVSGDGRRALIGSWSEHAEVVDLATGSKVNPPLGRLDGSAGWQGGKPSVSMTPDGVLGLIGTHRVRRDNLGRIGAKEAGILWFWDLKTGKERFPRQQPYKDSITSVATSSDGRRGLTASYDGELTLWDLTTGQPLRSLASERGEVYSHTMTFFRDGRRAATAGKDQLVHIWDLETWHETVLNGHDASISSLAISADGHRMLSGSHDSTVILWDVDRQAILHRFRMPPNNEGAEVAFDSDGNIVAAGHGVEEPAEKPGSLIAWDAGTFAEVRRDERPFARHFALAALSDGRLLTGDRYALRLWTPRQPDTDSSGPTAGTGWGTSPVNLIDQVATSKPADWNIEGGELLSPTTGGARLQFPIAPPPEYRIDLEVERGEMDHDYVFALGIVVDGRQAEVAFDKREERDHRCTGLNGLDGVPVAYGRHTHHGPLLIPSHPARFSLTVRRRAISLTSGGINILNWKGDPRRFVRFIQWRIPDPRKLFLATTGPVKFRKITLTPLTASNP